MKRSAAQYWLLLAAGAAATAGVVVFVARELRRTPQRAPHRMLPTATPVIDAPAETALEAPTSTPPAPAALPLWVLNLALVLVGIGLAIVLVVALVVVSGSGAAVSTAVQRSPLLPTVSGACQLAAAPQDWLYYVNGLVDGYHPPCRTVTWGGEEFPEQTFSHNNYGLRDTLLTLEKPVGVYRILILGDSFPQGWEVPLESGFPYLLEQQLTSATSRPVEVINMGIHAYGTDSELLVYAALGWQFQPDLVLLMAYTGNDIQDNEINLEQLRYSYRLNRAFFTLDDSGDLLLHGKPGIAPFDPALYPDSPAWAWLTTQQTANSPAPEYRPPPAPAVLTQSPYQLEYPVEMGLYLAQSPTYPGESYWEDAWALTDALIRQLRDLVEAQGSQFAVAIIPDRRAVQRGDWEALVTQYTPLLDGLDPTLPATRLSSTLQAEGIATLDLTGAMRGWVATNSPSARLYFALDGHFTPDGHALVATRLSDWLFNDAGLALP